MRAALQPIQSLVLSLSLVLALTWNDTSAFSALSRVVCLAAVVAYLVSVLLAILLERLRAPTVPVTRPVPPDLWDRDVDGPAPF